MLQAARVQPRRTDPRVDVACQQLQGLLVQVARKFARHLPSHVELDDLVGAGALGLVMAVRNHLDEPRPCLIRLAEHRIRGAILDHLRSTDPLTRRQRAAVSAMAKVTARRQREGAPSDIESVANEMGMSVKRAERIRNRLATVQMVALEGCEPAATTQSPLDRIDSHQARARVAAALATLPPRMQTLLSLYYREELTYSEIARVLGISRSRISQLHTQAMTLLRTRLSAARDRAA
jgi:RNA polymerase sigma factor for flagellar operon FliA